MIDSINLSWEWIFGILITILLAFIGYLVKQNFDFDHRIRSLENESSSEKAKIDTLEKFLLRPFEKGEKEE